jgi:hydrogenase maturation factor
LQYIELDTQVVSSAASVGCTIISGHTYVRNRSRQYIMSASIVFRNQEDIALVDMLAEHSVLQYSISYIAVHQT